VGEIVPLLSSKRASKARLERIAKLLDGLAGTDFGLDADRFQEWVIRWIGRRHEGFESSRGPVTIQLTPEEPADPPSDPFPLKSVLTLALLAVLTGMGFLLSKGTGKREAPVGGDAEPGPDEDAPRGALTRLGKWIFDNRIVVLLPWFLPPIFLFDAARMPSLGWRSALYVLVLAGVLLRIRCTGFRSWAYRSSGARHLMTAGPYSYARHPIYVANFLIALPFFLAVNVWPLTVGFTVWFALTHLAIVMREDEILKFRYGDEWARYAGKVHRIIPRLSPFQPRSGDFSWEPVFKGQELPKGVAFLFILPMALEVLSGPWTSVATRIRDFLEGFV
jgi:protein-S-isoprenylcysteine O-methyltransferase Ste14